MENESPVRCLHPECGKEYSNQRKLRRHVNDHHVPFKCNDCDKEFTQRSTLKKHQKNSHSKWICEHVGCFKVARHQESYDAHHLTCKHALVKEEIPTTEDKEANTYLRLCLPVHLNRVYENVLAERKDGDIDFGHTATGTATATATVESIFPLNSADLTNPSIVIQRLREKLAYTISLYQCHVSESLLREQTIISAFQECYNSVAHASESVTIAANQLQQVVGTSKMFKSLEPVTSNLATDSKQIDTGAQDPESPNTLEVLDEAVELLDDVLVPQSAFFSIATICDVISIALPPLVSTTEASSSMSSDVASARQVRKRPASLTEAIDNNEIDKSTVPSSKQIKTEGTVPDLDVDTFRW